MQKMLRESQVKGLRFILICITVFLLVIPLPAKDSLPNSSRQLILVISDSWSSAKGYLYRFERKSTGDRWQEISVKIPAVLGRNGMAWGRGLHSLDSSMVPVKKEGDGKTPAGIFILGPAFGRAPQDSLRNLKIPYMQISNFLECIDDPESDYYNTLVLSDTVQKVDWGSSEKMGRIGIWYDLGVVINHNKEPILKGAGSCIFLHNWSRPEETSAGCTEVAPPELIKIIHWLNAGEHPLIVQLPLNEYKKYQQELHLPSVDRRQ